MDPKADENNGQMKRRSRRSSVLSDISNKFFDATKKAVTSKKRKLSVRLNLNYAYFEFCMNLDKWRNF